MENQLELREQQETRERRFPRLKMGRRTIAVSCAVLLIATAVVLNIVLFSGKGTSGAVTPSGGDVSEGEGTVVSSDGYFSATQVSRQRARDEALEVLQSVVENESADEATKTEALMEIADLAKAMEAEANIESLILAKGFAQCVAVINGETCSIVVSGGALQENQISQINEIVFEQAGIKPANVRIVTR